MKRFRTWSLVCFAMIFCSFPAFAEPLSPTQRRIERAVVDQVLQGDTEGVRVVVTPDPMEPGRRYEMLWSGGSVEIPPGAVWLAVVDHHPGVLGYHPVQHVFLDRDVNILNVREATFYPRFYVDGDRRGFVTLIAFRASPGKVPSDREPAVPQTGVRESTESFTYNDFYAVIIEGDVPSGDSYSEFWTDNVQIFRMLLEYGYLDDHIHVLYGEGHDEDDWFCSYYREHMVDFPAYQQDVRNVFTWMRDGNPDHGIPQVTPDDFLFLFTFDHGGGSGCDSTLCLMDGCMPDTEFASYFNQIAYKHRAVDMQQCHSGGFIDNLENDRTVISTAANCTESAYEADEQDTCDGHPVKYGEWNYWWTSAMRGHKPWPGLEPVDADANGDGMVSFLEAHNYALDHDDRSEHPQWSDLGGIGDQLSLNTTFAGAHLIHDSHEIQDDSGNGDGVADAGESIVMPTVLANNGDTDATAITTTLSTDNSWITVEDSAASYPDIPSGGSAESLPDHYLWSSDPETPDNTSVRFRLDWTANGGVDSGNTQFFQKVVRVILDVQHTSVDDQEGGDGDGIADAGESIRLIVTLRNRGHADARLVHGTLSTSSSYATITDDQADFADVPGQGSGESLPDHFGLDIAPDAPDKTWIECTLDVTAESGYATTLPLRFMVGSRGAVLLVEDGDTEDADLLESLIGDLGFGVDREAAAVTDPASWGQYDILVWASGTNADSVSDPAWRDALEQHVADGGRLLMEGGELGYNHRSHTSFRMNVLRMDSWLSNQGGDIHALDTDHPLATTPNVLDSTIPLLATGGSNQDAVRPRAGDEAVLDWTARLGDASVVVHDDDTLEGNGGQVVDLFTACRLVDDGDGQRGALVENALQWLLGNGGPYLVYDGHTILDADLGNGDAVADPGETLHLRVNLANHGSGTATDVWVRATTDHPSQIAFSDNYADWPDIPSGASAVSRDPHFVLRVAEDTPCGTVISVSLEIRTNEGFHATRSFSFKVGTGGGDHTTYVPDDTPMNIPNPGTAVSLISVPDPFRVGDVNCHVDVTHSSTTLIRVTLFSPEGTQVVLHDRDDWGSHLETTYDSETQPHGPGSMSDFDGQEATGDWELHVEDFQQDMMQGVLNQWSLIFDTADLCHEQSCPEPVPGGVGDTLRLSRIAGTDVHLEWAPTTGASGYNIWRSRHADMRDSETSGSTPETWFDEVGLPQEADLYFYVVRAENTCREEGP